MALAPVQFISDFMEDYPNYWLKFYEQGTVNPLAMATDKTGGTTVAKAEISAGPTPPIGTIKTAGGAIFIPYVDEAYDAYIFPTEAEADANDTVNAIQLADDVDFLQGLEESLNIIKPFDTVALMVASTTLSVGDIVETAGYLSKGDGGDNRYEVVAAATGTVDGLEFIDLATHQAKALFPLGVVNIKQSGATGDGVENDTTELEAWFAYGQTSPLTGDKGTYLYTGTGLVTATDLIEDFVLTGNGMTINCDPSTEHLNMIYLQPADASTIGRIEVTGIEINGNAEFGVGIRIDDSSASNHSLEEVTVHNVIVDNLDNLVSVSTTAGVRVDAVAKNISIERCSATNITRTQVNPGNIASTGIAVFNATGIVTITQNTIDAISSPFGDADADGIVVFGAQNGTPTALDSGKVTIDNNDFKNCKGRFVKSQHTNTTVNNNRGVISDNEVLITNWRFADFQNGNGICTNNEIIFGTNITAEGGGSVSNAYARFSNVKDVTKQTSMCSGNVLKNEDTSKWQQIIISVMDNNDNSVNVHDNDFAQSNLMVLHDGDTGDFNEGFYIIHDNTIEIKANSLFEVVSNQNYSNLFVSVTDNENIDTSTGLNRQVFPLPTTDVNTFSLQSNFVVRGNKTMIERVEWVFNFDRLHIGNAFSHGAQVNTNDPFVGEGHVIVDGMTNTAIPADALTRYQRVVTATGATPTWSAWTSVTYA